jgi:membrane-associated phospholipid phosphatase
LTTRRSNPGRVILAITAILAGFVVLTLGDHWIWAHLRVADGAAIEKKDWYQFFRQLGSLYIWGVAAGMLCLCDLARGRRAGGAINVSVACSRALLLFLSPALGGAAAEVLKVVVRRLRPGETGEYLFGWIQGVPHGPYGMASSHAGVAFGAAFMLARLFPPTAPVAIALACGCAVSRVIVGAHFATDTYVAAVMSYAVAAGLWRLAHRTTSPLATTSTP